MLDVQNLHGSRSKKYVFSDLMLSGALSMCLLREIHSRIGNYYLQDNYFSSFGSYYV